MPAHLRGWVLPGVDLLLRRVPRQVGDVGTSIVQPRLADSALHVQLTLRPSSRKDIMKWQSRTTVNGVSYHHDCYDKHHETGTGQASRNRPHPEPKARTRPLFVSLDDARELMGALREVVEAPGRG